MCFEFVFGCFPFEGELEPCRVGHDVIVGRTRPKFPSDLDDKLKSNLIQKLWSLNPTLRPTFQ